MLADTNLIANTVLRTIHGAWSLWISRMDVDARTVRIEDAYDEQQVTVTTDEVETAARMWAREIIEQGENVRFRSTRLAAIAVLAGDPEEAGNMDAEEADEILQRAVFGHQRYA